MNVSPIPAGHNAVSPYLVVKDVAKMIDFLITVFEGEKIEGFLKPDGSLMHGEVKIHDSVIMIGQAQPEWSPQTNMIHIYVEDVDATYEKALASGAQSIMPPADQFYGNRESGVTGPMGNSWWIATHKEDLSHEEMMERMKAQGRA